MQWIDSSRHRITGPYRNIYHRWTLEGDAAALVTEIQFPIAPVGAA
jgi:hypothetical protein